MIAGQEKTIRRKGDAGIGKRLGGGNVPWKNDTWLGAVILVPMGMLCVVVAPDALWFGLIIIGIGVFFALPTDWARSPERRKSKQNADKQTKEAYAAEVRPRMMEKVRQTQMDMLGESHIPKKGR